MLYNARKTRGRYKYQTKRKNAQDGAKDGGKRQQTKTTYTRHKRKTAKKNKNGAHIMRRDRATATRQTNPQTAKTKQTERAKTRRRKQSKTERRKR